MITDNDFCVILPQLLGQTASFTPPFHGFYLIFSLVPPSVTSGDDRKEEERGERGEASGDRGLQSLQPLKSRERSGNYGQSSSLPFSFHRSVAALCPWPPGHTWISHLASQCGERGALLRLLASCLQAEGEASWGFCNQLQFSTRKQTGSVMRLKKSAKGPIFCAFH